MQQAREFIDAAGRGLKRPADGETQDSPDGKRRRSHAEQKKITEANLDELCGRLTDTLKRAESGVWDNQPILNTITELNDLLEKLKDQKIRSAGVQRLKNLEKRTKKFEEGKEQLVPH